MTHKIRYAPYAPAPQLYCYDLPPDTFECADACAGYFVSRLAVEPLRVQTIDDPIDELLRRGVELRVLPELWTLHDAVARSTLQFSMIRMRNARARGGAWAPCVPLQRFTFDTGGVMRNGRSRPARRAWWLSVLAGWSAAVCFGAAGQSPVAELVDAAVQTAKGGDQYASEVRSSRRSYAFDADGDGDADAISVFLIEGFNLGNNYSVFMALHANENGTLETRDVVRIGERTRRYVDVDGVSFEDGTIRVAVRTFVPADANCCPSRESEAIYRALAGRLVEQTTIEACLDPNRCWWPLFRR